MSKQSIRKQHEFYNWDEEEDEGRRAIHEWSRRRIQKMQGLNKSYYGCLVYSFHWETMRSFVENFNFMVILQMVFAAVGVYIFDHFEIHYNFNVGLFVSPIVFPLAFSINTDFQRREKVLDDLANFKASSMLYFFCMREWKKGAGLSDAWMNQIQQKLHSIMFKLREYLLTSRKDRRQIIARYMYEDYSDCSQLIDNLRESKKLTSNPALISRAYHLLGGICLSFEKLRVIREYRSPRSIRSFNKVLVMLLPILLCPYFVALARDQGVNHWGAYFIAVLVAGVFGALQGVQDKLDDPFDGMSEDDINLDTIDEWTFNSLANAGKRDVVGYRQYVDDDEKKPGSRKSSLLPNIVSAATSKDKITSSSSMLPPPIGRPSFDAQSPLSYRSQGIAELLQQIEKKDANKKKKNPFKRAGSKAIKMERHRTGSEGDQGIPLIDVNQQRSQSISSPPKSPTEKNVKFDDESNATPTTTAAAVNIDTNNKLKSPAITEEPETFSYFEDPANGNKIPIVSTENGNREDEALLTKDEKKKNDDDNDETGNSNDSFQVVVIP